MTHPLAADLDHVLALTRDLWPELRGARLFVTGGTGFFGRWLLEALLWADARLGLGVKATVLTRDPEGFRARSPHLAGYPAVRLLPGDVARFRFPAVRFTHVIHGAAEASAALNAAHPLVMFDTIAAGTRRTLELAHRAGAARVLFVSSGAVYGRQPSDLAHLPEDYAGGPDPTAPASAYAEGKRVGELLCALYARAHGLHVPIARCFAFVGPHLPLDTHFAAGNFLRDGLRGGPIRVAGDGTPWRSYLYAADLAVWLWTILLRGESGRPYNVGSEDGVTIAQLAAAAAEAFDPPSVITIARTPTPGATAERYVPSTARARTELGLRQTVDLHEALRRTARFHGCERDHGSR